MLHRPTFRRSRRRGFFIIWGSRGLVSNDAAGSIETVCPRCQQRALIMGKTVRRWFTFYWIPIFPVGGDTRFCECSACHFKFADNIDQFRASLHGVHAQGASTFSQPRGDDVTSPVTLTAQQALSGVTIEVDVAGPGSAVETITVQVPAGVREGTHLRVPGKGNLGPGGRGDLFVQIHIQYAPTANNNPRPAAAGAQSAQNARQGVQDYRNWATAVLESPIGIGTTQSEFSELIPAGQQLPKVFSDTFANSEDGQKSVEVKLSQKHRDGFEIIATIVADKLPPRPKGTLRVLVTLTVNARKELRAKVTVTETGFVKEYGPFPVK